MIKLFAMESNSNVAVAINGRKRENFVEGDKVLVTRDEYLSLLRLGFTFLGEAEVTYSDVSKLIVSPEDKAKAEAKAAEANKPKKAEKAAKNSKKAEETAETPAEVPAETPETAETIVEASADVEQ